jgi:hypothetical protein
VVFGNLKEAIGWLGQMAISVANFPSEGALDGEEGTDALV